MVQLSKVFVQAGNQLQVLNGVSYPFCKGRTYAIIGASGTGKSTLLHLMAGLDRPTAGSVQYGDAILGNSIADFGIVLQKPSLISELSVLENVMLKGLVVGRSKKDCVSQAQVLLKSMNLAHKEYEMPSTLSGGQQQRVALARALFDQPDFLFADEPTGNLDEATGAHMIDLLLDHQQRSGMGVIISTHDRAVARRMDTVLELKQGKLQEVSHV